MQYDRQSLQKTAKLILRRNALPNARRVKG